MTELLAQLKNEYHITESTPSGRIGWAINDYIASHDLTTEERNSLIMASDAEVRGE